MALALILKLATKRFLMKIFSVNRHRQLG